MPDNEAAANIAAPPARSPMEPLLGYTAATFPRSDEVPEGCRVIDDWEEDDLGHPVDITEETYVTRRLSDGSAVDLPMWIYSPAGVRPPDEGWPVVVFVRGSAFHEQNVLGFTDCCVRIAARGYLVAAPKYRHSDIAPFPAQMQDCKTAVRYVRAHAGRLHADPERVALWGESSGAHTVLMAGFTGDTGPDTEDYREFSAEVRCIVDWYGPTDFAMMNYYPSAQNHHDPDSPEGWELGHVDVLERLEDSRLASPMTYLVAERPTPPTLIMHGGRDMLVPFNQSCRLYARMRELGKDVMFIKLAEAGHGCRGFRSERALGCVADFLAAHMG